MNHRLSQLSLLALLYVCLAHIKHSKVCPFPRSETALTFLHPLLFQWIMTIRAVLYAVLEIISVQNFVANAEHRCKIQHLDIHLVINKWISGDDMSDSNSFITSPRIVSSSDMVVSLLARFIEMLLDLSANFSMSLLFLLLRWSITFSSWQETYKFATITTTSPPSLYAQRMHTWGSFVC